MHYNMKQIDPTFKLISAFMAYYYNILKTSYK